MYVFIHTDWITGSAPGIPYSQIHFRQPSKVHSAFSSYCTHTSGSSLKIGSTLLSPAYYSFSTVSTCFLICALVYYILEVLSISFLIFLTFYEKYTRLSSGSSAFTTSFAYRTGPFPRYSLANSLWICAVTYAHDLCGISIALSYLHFRPIN